MRHLLLVLVVLPGCASTGSTSPASTSTATAPTSSGTMTLGSMSNATSATSGGGTGASTASGSTSVASGDAAAGSCVPAFSDGFENDTAGAPPDQSVWHSYMGCNASQTPPDAGAPGGGLLIGVDGAQHRSGKNSLKVIGTAGDGCGFYAIQTSAFANLGSQMYVRFYARFSGMP